MNTKTKLRKAQNIEKYEEIYKKIEQTYKEEFGTIVAKKNRRLTVLLIILLIGLTALLIAFAHAIDEVLDMKAIAVAGASLILALIVAFSVSPEEKNFVTKFKKRIIGMLIKEIEADLEYEPALQNEKDILDSYKIMGFEPSNCNLEHVDDKIAGKLSSGVNVRVSNVCIKEYSAGNKGTSVIFNGLFTEMETPKKIDADIRILLPTTQYLGNSDGCEKIETDSLDFEKQFNVYTNNKILTLQILTSDVMEKLTSYYEKYGMQFELAIRNGKVSTRIETGNMFESILARNKLHKEDMFVYYSILNFTFGLLNDINNIINNLEI